MIRRLRLVLGRIFAPECPGGCRQPVSRCCCSWLPPLPDEVFTDD